MSFFNLPQEYVPGSLSAGGFGQGFSSGLQESLQKFHQQKESQEKARSKLPSAFKFYSEQFGTKDLPEDEKLEIYKNARNLIDQGFGHEEAIETAYSNYFNQPEQKPLSKKQKDLGIGETDMSLRPLLGAFGYIPEIKKGLKDVFSPPSERAPAEPRKNIPELLKQAEEAGPAIYNKFLSTLGNEELMSLPREKRQELSKYIGSEVAPYEVGQTLARGLLGKQGAERLREIGNMPEVEFAGPGGQAVGETTGRLLRDLGLFGAAGQAPTMVKRAATAGGLFGGAKAGEQLLAGEEPTVKSVGKEALFGAAAQIAPEVLQKVFRFVKARIPVKAPSGKPPSIKQIEFKPGEVPPTPKPGPQNAQEAQTLYNDIVNESVKNLQGRGITLEAINSGDAKAITELQKESVKVAEMFKKADKLNVDKFTKQRQDILKNIAQSPLEKYYAPPKEVNKRPETLAKEAIRIEPLERSIKQNERRVRDLQYQILSADEAIRTGNFTQPEIDRILATRRVNAMDHTKAMDAIKNAKFEIKYGRPPASIQDIGKQIDDTFAQLREGIKNPSAKKVEQFRKGFERDKHLIDEAKRLADRGELPGPEVFDEYIKIHNEYIKSYDSLVNELSDFIREAKISGKSEQEIANAKSLMDLIKKNQKLSKAKLQIQKDKRKAMNILEKPSGSFIKNSLKETKKDIEAFQKDFFKWNKLATGTEAKTAKISAEKIKPFPEVSPPKSQAKEAESTFKKAEEGAKNPNSSSGKTAAERAGMTKEEYQDYIKRISEKTQKMGEDVKKGTGTVEDEKTLLKDLLSKYNSMSRFKRSIINGFFIGTLQGLSEEYLGWKPRQELISLGIIGAIPGGYKVRIGTSGTAALLSQGIKKAFNYASAQRLQSLRRNPREYNDYMKKLKSKYGDARANKIRKEALQSS